MVGAYNGQELRQFIRGQNMAEFPEWIQDRALLVTFFGTGFDLPVLRRAFQMEFPQLHVDLCFLLKRLGYSGGLKRVEEEIGVRRPEHVAGLSGWDAVRLWWEWRRGSRSALQILLDYNAQDVRNLERLLDFAYPRIQERTLSGPE